MLQVWVSKTAASFVAGALQVWWQTASPRQCTIRYRTGMSHVLYRYDTVKYVLMDSFRKEPWTRRTICIPLAGAATPRPDFNFAGEPHSEDVGAHTVCLEILPDHLLGETSYRATPRWKWEIGYHLQSPQAD
jgi:hypothetical protein